MGIILSALGGAANEGLREFDRQDKEASDLRLMQARSADDLNRQKTLALFQQGLKDAPLQRVGAAAQQAASTQVPVQAAPVTSLSGVYASDAGPSNGGFTGSPGLMNQAISAWPEGADRDVAMAQLKQQVGQAQHAAQVDVAGQTRPLTSDEAFSAALDKLKINDPVAYAAGKTLQGDKTVTVPDGATVIDRTGKIIFDGSGSKDARQNQLEDRKDQRQQNQLNQQMTIAQMRDEQQSARLDAIVGKAGGGANGTRDALSFINGTRLDLASQSQNLKAQYALDLNSAILPDDKAKIRQQYQPKFDEIDAKRARIESDFNSLRTRIGLLPVAPAVAFSDASQNSAGASNTAQPATQSSASSAKQNAAVIPSLPTGAKQIGTSGGKPVFQTPDGKRFIGQ